MELVTKYLFTWSGTDLKLNVEYNTDAILCGIRFNGQFAQEQLRYIVTTIPLQCSTNTMEDYAVRIKANMGVLNYELTFDLFYDAYGVKEGKKKAEASWKKLSAGEQLKAYLYIKTLEGKLKISGLAKPYPATYLNNKRWED